MSCSPKRHYAGEHVATSPANPYAFLHGLGRFVKDITQRAAIANDSVEGFTGQLTQITNVKFQSIFHSGFKAKFLRILSVEV